MRGEAFIFGFEDRFCQNSFLTGRLSFNEFRFLEGHLTGNRVWGSDIRLDFSKMKSEPTRSRKVVLTEEFVYNY